MNEKQINIGNVKIGDGLKPVTIAEAAVEHLGSLNVAMRMAEMAKEIKADFIKFQMHIPEKEMVPDVIKFWGGSLDEILENYNLTIEDHKKLKSYCDKIGIEYLCTPFCPDAVDVLEQIGVNGFKTGSGEMTNFPMMAKIADTGKPVIISTGMSSIDEIEETVNYLKSMNVEFMLTNCTSIYPPPYESINLNLIPKFKEKFNVLIGHSDHTPDIWTSLGAISVGACLVEKHFTLNKGLKGPDYAVSIEPKEFSDMIEAIEKIHLALGSEKIIHTEEIDVKNWANHSVVLTKDVEIGNLITEDNVQVKRPGTGIPAKELNKVIGNKVNKDLKKNTILQWTDLSK